MAEVAAGRPPTFPRKDIGNAPVEGVDGETWDSFIQAARRGGRHLEEKMIFHVRIERFLKKAADAYKAEHGFYPPPDSKEDILEIPEGVEGVKWAEAAEAVRAISFLSLMYGEQDLKRILIEIGRGFKQENGRWPRQELDSQVAIESLPGETWGNFRTVLAKGRGKTPLKGGMSFGGLDSEFPQQGVLPELGLGSP